MARITDLPHEILCLILEYLPLDDLETFPRANRRIYAASTRRLKERNEIRSKFSRITSSSATDYLGTFFKRVVKNPCTAHYVKHVEIRHWGDGFFNAGEYPLIYDGVRRIAKRHHRIAKYLLEHVMMVQDDNGRYSLEPLYNGSDDRWENSPVYQQMRRKLIMIPLITLVLPNMTSLTIRDLMHWTDQLMQFFTFILRCPAEIARWKLHTLTIKDTFSAVETVEGFSLLATLARLPSLKTINIRSTRITARPPPSKLLPRPSSSNVTELNVYGLEISETQMISLLECFRSLQRFTYWPDATPLPCQCLGTRRDNHCLRIVPSSHVIKGLLPSAQDTLRFLSVHTQTFSRHCMGALREFRRLEEIHIDLDILIDPRAENPSPGQALPASIKHVKIFAPYADRYVDREIVGGTWSYAAVLRDIVREQVVRDLGREKNAFVPDLSLLKMDAFEMYVKDREQILGGICGDVGITLRYFRETDGGMLPCD